MQMQYFCQFFYWMSIEVYYSYIDIFQIVLDYNKKKHLYLGMYISCQKRQYELSLVLADLNLISVFCLVSRFNYEHVRHGLTSLWHKITMQHECFSEHLSLRRGSSKKCGRSSPKQLGRSIAKFTRGHFESINNRIKGKNVESIFSYFVSILFSAHKVYAIYIR